MRIALASDHRGVEAVQALQDRLTEVGHDARILGQCDGSSCDYPDQAYLVGRAVGNGEADRGILICGSGIGMTIAANKMPGVRAALVHGEHDAEMSRRHNNANVLCLSGDGDAEQAFPRIVDIWLNTDFEGGRHARRVEKIMAIERGEDPSKAVAEQARA